MLQYFVEDGLIFLSLNNPKYVRNPIHPDNNSSQKKQIQPESELNLYWTFRTWLHISIYHQYFIIVIVH